MVREMVNDGQELLPPEEPLCGVAPWSDLTPFCGVMLGKDDRLRGQLIPIRFNLDQDANASVQHALVDPAWRGLTIGQDTVILDVEAVFIPIDSYVGPEFFGVDHLPCLKAILPLYRWALMSFTFEDQAAFRSVLSTDRRSGYSVGPTDQFVRVQFQGVEFLELSRAIKGTHG